MAVTRRRRTLVLAWSYLVLMAGGIAVVGLGTRIGPLRSVCEGSPAICRQAHPVELQTWVAVLAVGCFATGSLAGLMAALRWRATINATRVGPIPSWFSNDSRFRIRLGLVFVAFAPFMAGTVAGGRIDKADGRPLVPSSWSPVYRWWGVAVFVAAIAWWIHAAWIEHQSDDVDVDLDIDDWPRTGPPPRRPYD